MSRHTELRLVNPNEGPPDFTNVVLVDFSPARLSPRQLTTAETQALAHAREGLYDSAAWDAALLETEALHQQRMLGEPHSSAQTETRGDNRLRGTFSRARRRLKGLFGTGSENAINQLSTLAAGRRSQSAPEGRTVTSLPIRRPTPPVIA